MSYRAVSTHLTVFIDREKQKAKTTLTASGLIAAPQYEYMQYYLQYGKILSVGKGIKNPDVKVGRTALFHHLIEEDDRYLVEEHENGDQIRWVDARTDTTSLKLFGVITEQGDLLPVEPFVFCDPVSDEIPEEAFDVLEFGAEGAYRAATVKKGLLYLPITGDPREQVQHYKPTVISVPTGDVELEPGQQILLQDFGRYPLTLEGKELWACNKEFIVAVIEPQ